MGIMNEPYQAVCPSCGYHNQWYAMYCRSCGKVFRAVVRFLSDERNADA